jgi:predicted site-specific integrase-resolvase
MHEVGRREPTLYSPKEASQLLGINQTTLRTWDKHGKIKTIRTPGGFRRYDLSSILHSTTSTDIPHEKISVCYCRVSSSHQSDDLQRQIQYLQSLYPKHVIIQDIASGINFKRRGLSLLVEYALSGKLHEVIVAHKDRLARFGFDLLALVFKLTKVKLVVLDDSHHESPEQELADDLQSIVHVFSCRYNGRRRYKKTPEKITSQNETNGKTDFGPQSTSHPSISSNQYILESEKI